MTDRVIPGDGRFSKSPPVPVSNVASSPPAVGWPRNFSPTASRHNGKLSNAAATTANAPPPSSPSLNDTSHPASPTFSSSHQQPQPPTISPLFTLVTNATRGTTHHPRIHYIFSDDDPDILHQALAQRYVSPLANADADEDRQSSPAPPSSGRAVVLDLVPTADGSWDVSWASSLSDDWAVVDSRISRVEEAAHHPQARRRQHGVGGGGGAAAAAAAQAADDGEDSESEKTLMLQIEGLECERPPVVVPESYPAGDFPLPSSRSGGSAGPSSGGAASSGREDPAVLVDEFRKRMGVIRRVVDVGEERIQEMERARRAEEEQERRKEDEEADEATG